MATQALDNFEKKWNLKYEYAIKSWKENWEHLTDVPLLKCVKKIRKCFIIK